MKKILFIFLFLITSLVSICQLDSMSFIFTKIATSRVKKYKVSPFQNADVKAGEVVRFITLFPSFDFLPENDAVLLVTEKSDSVWVEKQSFLEMFKSKQIWDKIAYMKYIVDRKFTDKEFSNVLNGMPWIGMKKDDLIITAGEPDKKNITVDKGGTIEIWQYKYYGIYYFQNNKLLRFSIGN